MKITGDICILWELSLFVGYIVNKLLVTTLGYVKLVMQLPIGLFMTVKQIISEEAIFNG